MKNILNILKQSLAFVLGAMAFTPGRVFGISTLPFVPTAGAAGTADDLNTKVAAEIKRTGNVGGIVSDLHTANLAGDDLMFVAVKPAGGKARIIAFPAGTDIATKLGNEAKVGELTLVDPADKTTFEVTLEAGEDENVLGQDIAEIVVPTVPTFSPQSLMNKLCDVADKASEEGESVAIVLDQANDKFIVYRAAAAGPVTVASTADSVADISQEDAEATEGSRSLL